MSIQSQAILLGHLRPHELVAMIDAVTGYHTNLRNGHKDCYKMIEVASPAGVEIIHLFLDSSVADDYRDVTEEPATFISVQSSPFASNMVKRIVEVRGGFFRKSEMDQWGKIDPTITNLAPTA